GEDGERHGTQTKEITCHVLRETGDQEDHETDNGAFGFDDEAEFAPDLWAHEALNVMGAQPPPHGEGREGSDGQTDRRVEKPHPFAEQVAAKDPRHLAGNGGNDDLQRLHADKDDGSEDAPLSQRVLEEALVHVETDEELISRSVRKHEPSAIPYEPCRDRTANDPPDLRLPLPPRASPGARASFHVRFLGHRCPAPGAMSPASSEFLHCSHIRCLDSRGTLVSSACPSLIPFLNSLRLEPSDRAIWGSRLAPNMILGANSTNYHSTRPSGSRGGLKDDQTHTLGTEFRPTSRNLARASVVCWGDAQWDAAAPTISELGIASGRTIYGLRVTCPRISRPSDGVRPCHRMTGSAVSRPRGRARLDT